MERESGVVVQGGQPYLRSGRGTQNRQYASQSANRYIPKGGFIIDFTTQPLPKGKGVILSNGCQADVPKEVLIARQQRAAARLSVPRHSATSSPASRNLQLPDLEIPDHPKPWGAPSCKVPLKENVRPHQATISHAKQAAHPLKVLLPPECLTPSLHRLLRLQAFMTDGIQLLWHTARSRTCGIPGARQ